MSGFAGLPTLHRPDAAQQFLFVNGRPVKDKLLIGAVRAAYGDLIPRGRQPLLALFVSLPPRGGRRQRPPGKGRGALPRQRPRALAAGQRAGGGAARRRPPRIGCQRRIGAAGVAPQRRAVRAPAAGVFRRAAQLGRLRSGRGDAGAARRHGLHRAPTPAPSPHPLPRRCRIARSAPRARSCTRTTSSPRRATASSSSTSTPRTSGSSTSG